MYIFIHIYSFMLIMDYDISQVMLRCVALYDFDGEENTDLHLE